MKIKLTRPLAFIDIESTGTDRKTDRIIELGIVILSPDGTRSTRRFLIDPGMPIPPASTEVHGITDDDVSGCPFFQEAAPFILEAIRECDLAGFNSNRFDFPLLHAEFSRVGITWDYHQHRMIDVGNIFKIHEPRTLGAAVKFYLGHDLEDAHSAIADIDATVDVFLAQMDRYEGLRDMGVSELALHSNYDLPILDLSGNFTMSKDNKILLNVGKHKGQPAENHIDFVEWMLYRASFPPDTQQICAEILKNV